MGEGLPDGPGLRLIRVRPDIILQFSEPLGWILKSTATSGRRLSLGISEVMLRVEYTCQSQCD